VWAATRRDLNFFTAGGWRKRTGLALIGYAFVYPILNVTFGHEYPGTPTFGVPCPTAILTLGLLLTVRAGAGRWLAIVPMLWGFVAGFAALLFNVWPDYPLVLASIVVATDLVARLVSGALWRRVELRVLMMAFGVLLNSVVNDGVSPFARIR
jgi:hypothetical protein